jgi:hypothetical protein
MQERDKKLRFQFFDKEVLEEEQNFSDHTAPTLGDLAIKQAVLIAPKIFFLEKVKNEIVIY